MTENKNRKNNESKGNEFQLLFMLIMGLMTLWVYKNEAMIKVWFFEKMFTLILGGIALTFALAKWILYRMRKNNTDHFQRSASLQGLKPKQNLNDFYSRPNRDKQNRGPM